jgi:hypothetical protein
MRRVAGMHDESGLLRQRVGRRNRLTERAEHVGVLRARKVDMAVADLDEQDRVGRRGGGLAHEQTRLRRASLMRAVRRKQDNDLDGERRRKQLAAGFGRNDLCARRGQAKASAPAAMSVLGKSSLQRKTSCRQEYARRASG